MKYGLNIALTLILALPGTAAWAMGPHGEIETTAELVGLPSYCKGTLVTRYTLPDPKPFQEYLALYGEAFNHLHHYCWALNQENHMDKLGSAGRNALYGPILGNFQYILGKAPDGFALLPEIYLSKARILFKYNHSAEAVEALLKLIQLKPAYAQTYAQLGDYYQRKNERASAIKWYEQGLTQTSIRNAEYFIWKLKKLDSRYTPPAEVLQAIEEQKKQQAAAATESGQNDGEAAAPSAPPSPEAPPASSVPAPAANDARPNPYCRFCP